MRKNKQVNIDDLISIIFIVGSILNIYANQLHNRYLEENDINSEVKAKEIYIFVIIVTIILYLYFVKRNYGFLMNAKRNNLDTSLLTIRFIGSVLLIIGISFILYYEVNSEAPRGLPA